MLFRSSDSDLVGTLIVRSSSATDRTIDGVLSHGAFNLTSTTTRRSRARELEERSGDRDLDWATALERLCWQVQRAELEGVEEIRPLASYAPSAGDDAAWLWHGVPILQRHPMLLFGDGGTGKSFLSLSIAAHLAAQGVATLYCDWEFSPEEHRARLGRLCGDALPTNLLYVRCTRPLIDESGQIGRAHV